MKNAAIFTLLFMAAFSAQLRAETYTVTTAADQGSGSLREALTLANARAGADTIIFAIPPDDSLFDGAVWHIRPQTILPPVVDGGLWINGASQDSSSGNTNPFGPDILIDGSDIITDGIGFLVYSGGNKISGLTISGFADFGIRLRDGSAVDNRIQGNYIGTDPTGSEVLSNGIGIYISRDSGYNLIGGGHTSQRNIISGNTGNGIYLTNSRGSIITGNYIGTDRTGTASVPNALDGKSSGIDINYGCSHTTVGGPTEQLRNIISGNGRDGIHIARADSSLIIGNFIGTDVSGLLPLANSTCGVGDGIDIRYEASHNVIGGSAAGEGNVICGSQNAGIRIHRQGRNNYIRGNFIGVTADGNTPIGNHNQGIYIYDGSCHNVVGGTEPGEGNVIAGNSLSGIEIFSAGADSNIIAGNIIGLGADGISPVPNRLHGIFIHDSTACNHIGPANIISGNDSCGIVVSGSRTTGNRIFANLIGLDANGAACAANGLDGIALLDSASFTVIGDTAASAGNSISGNQGSGIRMVRGTRNHILNNRIGADTGGSSAPGNRLHGIRLSGSHNYLAHNIIAGNDSCGIVVELSSSANRFNNNAVGVVPLGPGRMSNGSHGIYYRPGCMAANDTVGPANLIAANDGFGIVLGDSGISGITITGNSIFKNSSGAVSLRLGANRGVEAPQISGQDPLSGTAQPGAVVEIYSDSSAQGQFFEAAVTADLSGFWHYAGTVSGPNITACATDTAGNTSEFSAFSVVPVAADGPLSAGGFGLQQNYPNPFNPETVIPFTVPEISEVHLHVFNVKGQLIRTLLNGVYLPGSYEVVFSGTGLPSGMYLYRIEAGAFSGVKKMLLLE